MTDDVFRIIDANLNRASEGLRVLEETARLVWNDPIMSTELKNLRHDISAVFHNNRNVYSRIMHARDSAGDVFCHGETPTEKKRPDLFSLAMANSRRAAEAMRALEEYSKLVSTDASGEFKRIRFHLYEIEKVFFQRIESEARVKKEHLAAILSVDVQSCPKNTDECVKCAMDSGVGTILYRDKISNDRLFAENLTRLKYICDPARIPVIAADRVDAAVAADADGVVIGSDDLPADLTRTILGSFRSVARSFSDLKRMTVENVNGGDFILAPYHGGDDLGVVRKLAMPFVAVVDVRGTHGSIEKPDDAAGICVFAEHFDKKSMNAFFRKSDLHTQRSR